MAYYIDIILLELNIHGELVRFNFVNSNLGVHGSVLEATIGAEPGIQLRLLRNMKFGRSINSIGISSSLADDLVVILQVLFIVPGDKSFPSNNKFQFALSNFAHANISQLSLHHSACDLGSGLSCNNNFVIKSYLKVSVCKVLSTVKLGSNTTSVLNFEVGMEGVVSSTAVMINFELSYFNVVLKNISVQCVGCKIKVSLNLVNSVFYLDSCNNLFHWDSVNSDLIGRSIIIIKSSSKMLLMVTCNIQLKAFNNLKISTLWYGSDNSVVFSTSLGSHKFQLPNLLVPMI